MGSFVAKDVALLLHTPPSSALCLVTRVVEHACILSWHCSVASAQVISRFSLFIHFTAFFLCFGIMPCRQGCWRLCRHCQVEMFVSVAITPRLPHCDLRGQFCTYFHQDKFYLRSDHNPPTQ